MKINKLLFFIILLGFMTSCGVIEEQSKNPVQPQSSPSQTASDPVLPSSPSPEQAKQQAEKCRNRADEH